MTEGFLLRAILCDWPAIRQRNGELWFARDGGLYTVMPDDWRRDRVSTFTTMRFPA